MIPNKPLYKNWINAPLNDFIDKGSMTDRDHLKRLVKALNRRIHRLKGDLNNKLYCGESLRDEIHNASIYRDEFKSLYDSL